MKFLKTKKGHEYLQAFDRYCKNQNLRIDKEPKEMHRIGVVYQDGHVNKLFHAWLDGIAFGEYLTRNND